MSDYNPKDVEWMARLLCIARRLDPDDTLKEPAHALMICLMDAKAAQEAGE